MNSTITIEDIDKEVIDLDSSQDAINNTNEDESVCSIEKSSLLNDTANRVDVMNENLKNDKNPSKVESCIDIDIPNPIFKVIFRDENVSRQYCNKIKKFLEELVSSNVKSQENDNGLTLEIWDNDIDSTSQSIEITTESDDSQDIICDTLFTIDKQPKIKDDFDVPTYGKKYENVFDKTQVQSNPKPKDEILPRIMCFNCLENHNLRDCPKPRSNANVDKNRKRFNMKGGNTKTLRYHLEGDQKFGHLIPGQLSSNLRKALGLKDNELPKHIYRMRNLGYPPGWLEEARLQHSGLTLFNSDGIAEDDPNDEEGVIIEEGDRDQYDVRKIYDFPGFNVPPPFGTYDEHGQYWVSEIQNFNSKQRMLSMLRGKRADDGYKRKKLKVSNDTDKNSAPVSSEMEIEDVEESVVECIPVNGLFVPPLPPESTVKPPLPPELAIKSSLPSESAAKPPLPSESTVKPSEPPLPAAQSCSQDSDYHSQELQFTESLEDSISPSPRTNSPSLSDLENMKKQLLVELLETNSQSNSDISSKSNSSNSVSKSDMPPPSNEVTPESQRTPRNETRTSCGSVKVDLGTPVLQSTSPYNKLPSSEKFSKNICDVINFENLPNSTGKYKQMTGVLQKVRTTLAKLQQ